MSKQNKMKSVGNAVDPEIQNRAKQLQNEINEKLNEMNNAFNATEWNKLTLGGNPVAPLPETAIEDFKKAYHNKYSNVMVHVAKSIGISQPENIVYHQMFSLLTAISAADPSSWTKDYYEYLEKKERYDLIFQMAEAVHKEHKSEMELLHKTMISGYDPVTFMPLKTSKFHD